MGGVPSLPQPTVGLGAGHMWLEGGAGLCGRMVAMEAVLVWGLLVVARAVARAHQVSLGCGSRKSRSVKSGPGDFFVIHIDV